MCSQAPWQAPARALCCPALALCTPRSTSIVARKTETILVHMFCSHHAFLDSGVGEIKDTSKRCSLICFILRPPGPQAQGWGAHSPQYGKRLLFCWVHCTGCGNVSSTLTLGAGGVTATCFSIRCLLFRQHRYPGKCNWVETFGEKRWLSEAQAYL